MRTLSSVMLPFSLLLSGCFVGSFEDPSPPASTSELTPDSPAKSAAWLPWITTSGASFQHLSRDPLAPSNALWLTGSKLESDGSRSARVWSFTPSNSSLTEILNTQVTIGSDSNLARVRAESASRWLAAGSGKTGGITSANLWVSVNTGTTWTSLSTFQLDGAHNTETRDFQIDGTGRYLWLLHAQDASGVSHSLLRVSTDQGGTWTTLDDAAVEAGAHTIPTALLLPTATTIVVVGSAFQSGSEKAWIHRSTDSGVSWSDDLFQEIPGSTTRWEAITTGPSPADWTVCGTSTSGSQTAALLRSTSTSGATWTTLLTDRPAQGNQDCRGVLYESTAQKFLYVGKRTAPEPFGYLKLTGTSPSFLDSLRTSGMTTSQLDQLLWEPLNAGESFSIGSFVDARGVSWGAVRKLVTP